MSDQTHPTHRSSEPITGAPTVMDIDYALIFNAASNAMAFTEYDSGKIVEVNDAWTRSTGMTREYACGRTAYELGIWATMEAREACLAEIVERGYVVDFEANLTLKSVELPHTISGRVIDRGDKRYLLWEFRDISLIKQAEAALLQSKHRLESMLNAMPDLMFEVSADGRIHSYHSPRKDLLVVPPELFLDKHIREFLPADVADIVHGALATADHTGESFGTEYALTVEAGRRWFELSICKQASEPGAAPYFTMIARDITERKERESALAIGEERLRLALDASNQGWFDIELATGKVSVSPEYIRMIGYEPGEFETDLPNWMAHIHPEDRDALARAFKTCIEHGGQSVAEYRRQTKSGDWKWIRSVGKVVHWDTEKRATRMLGIHTDITDIKQAEEAVRQNERRFRAIIEASPIPIALNDEALNITYINSAFTRTFGYAHEDIPTVEAWWPKAYPDPAYRQKVADEWMTRLTTSQREGKLFDPVEVRIRCKNGEDKTVLVAAVPLEASLNDVHLVTLFDITERKQAEIELDRHRHQLEDLVRSRTAELATAKDAAETASRAKSTFFTNMSHELRTPMNGVMGMLELSMRRMADPKGLDHLDKAKGAAVHLLAVLNDILDISKIEAEHMVLEDVPLQLDTVLESLRNIVGHKADEKGLVLNIDLPDTLARLPLKGDAMRLGQVLLNLTANALKFTATGGVTISVRQVEAGTEAVQAHFDIVDSGIGIALDAQSRLFTAFEQVDSSMTRKYGGTGLGLAISKRLVQLMGGEIGVESTPGAGSRFWFTVRLTRAEPDAVSPAPTFANAGAELRLRRDFLGARVLLAEDEPVNREVACFQLEDAGLVVDLAEDGRQALELACRNNYALILMDMQMPDMNGIEATAAIRSNSLNTLTPILAMTANAFEEDRQVCLQAGMNDHIAKPVHPEKLYETLLRWLEHNSSRN